MSFEVELNHLSYTARSKAIILEGVDAQIPKGCFVALLGENGAGKTTLLDILMGFKAPTEGAVRVHDEAPHEDHWMQRQNIAYLSEKMDIPGDWSVREYLDFNKFFYKNYSESLEQELLREFRVKGDGRLGSMSAGEIRRVQIVGALSSQPQLIIVDEITAVLDIVGRRHFMKRLLKANQESQCTIVLATNILEDLENYISHLMLMHSGKVYSFQSLKDFLSGKEKHQFAQVVADQLEAL